MAPIIYMIRHGEKPGEDADGLSAEGLKRSEYLADFFGPNSAYKIGYIMAQTRGKNGKRARPYDTVQPLAEALHLKIDESVHRDDAPAAAAAAKAYNGPGNVLICWEHGALTDIAHALGIQGFASDPKKKIKYPGSRFDLIWEVKAPYTEITAVLSEHCPGLDDLHGGDVDNVGLGGVIMPPAIPQEVSSHC